MTDSTASAKDCGLLCAMAPTGQALSSNKNSPTALVLDATTGVPDARDSKAAKQKVSMGPGANEMSADARISARRFRSAM